MTFIVMLVRVAEQIINQVTSGKFESIWSMIMFTHYDYSISQFHHNSFKIRQRCKSCSCFQHVGKLRFEFAQWLCAVQLDLVEECWFQRGCSGDLEGFQHELDFASSAGFECSDSFQAGFCVRHSNRVRQLNCVLLLPCVHHV